MTVERFSVAGGEFFDNFGDGHVFSGFYLYA
jgi:hypothetical protein